MSISIDQPAIEEFLDGEGGGDQLSNEEEDPQRMKLWLRA
jgi:hypothetical protein